MNQDIRGEYLLRQDWLLLNNGSFGACPRPVFESYQRWQLEFEKHPGHFVGRWGELMLHARTQLAIYLHTDQSRLGFVTNATMGVNVATHALRSVLQPGDEVLTTEHEYGACDHAWQFNCGKTGSAYIRQPVELPIYNDEAFVDQFWEGVTARTRVIYMSHTTSPTALTFPVMEICRRARTAGIITVIDGAHVPGQRDLYLDDLGADIYTGNCHKWMCGPKGTAFVYVRPEVQHLIEPLIVGHGWFPEKRSEAPLVDYIENYGTRDLAGFLAVPDAIAYMQEREWDTVRARCHGMAMTTKQKIEGLLDTESICPEKFSWFSQLCPIRLPDTTDMGKLGALLHERYRIELPMLVWRNFKIARLSVQYYTTQAELDIFVEALNTHVADCQLEL